jgi:hypothetical protein
MPKSKEISVDRRGFLKGAAAAGGAALASEPVTNNGGQVLGSTLCRLTGPQGTSYEPWLSRPREVSISSV